jgi:glutathione synthase/RimK-type ligase-like ATP-grasp enzyme
MTTYQIAAYRRRVGGHSLRMMRALGGMNITPHHEPRNRMSDTVTIVNYGMSAFPDWYPQDDTGVTWLNTPDAVRLSSNKVRAFEAFTAAEVPTCKWTEDKEEAQRWYNNGKAVFARTILSGSQGRGIVVCDPSNPGTPLPDASLYTRNFTKTHEFRAHVAGGRLIDFVEKKSRSGVESDRVVRNHAGGWVFAHADLSAKASDFEHLAVSAVNALGLDFGGVDILASLAPGYNHNLREVRKAIVCEVNSAPAWECTATFDAYKEYFERCIAS